MIKATINHFKLSFFLFLSVASAQNYLGGPECVTWDGERQQYVVSNWTNGKIVTIDTNGVQAVFNEDITHAYGNCILGDTLFVSTGLAVVAFDLNTGETLFNLPIAGAQQMDGIAVDPDGYVYVLENINPKLFKIRLSDLVYWVFCEEGIGRAPQDILFEPEHQRILMVAFFPESPIYSVSLLDSTISELVTTPMGNFDGIAKDSRGNYYLSSWGTGAIHMYSSSFRNPPLLVSSGHNGPANIGANRDLGLIAVPNFNDNTVDFVPVMDSYLQAGLTGDVLSGHAPLTVQFSDVSYSDPQTDSRVWDFQNDGIVDSEQENPIWTFDLPGSYDVSLEINNGEAADKVLLPDYIRVFDGESALNFGTTSSNTIVEASESLNLRETLSMEAWVYLREWGSSPSFVSTILDKTNIWLFVVDNHTAINNQSLVLRIRHEDGTFSYSFSPIGSMALHEWMHIAVSYDSEHNEVSFYINGYRQETMSTVNPSGLIYDHSEKDLILGSTSNNDLYFKGIIDDVRIWNYVRSDEQIAQSNQALLSGNEAGLQAYWPMNEGQGDSLIDKSQFGNTMNIQGAEWIQGTSFKPTVAIDQEQIDLHPQRGLLLKQYPNPFNAQTNLSFKIETSGHVKLDILDVRGRIVRHLIHSTMMSGRQAFIWDAQDEIGADVASGVYIARLVHNDQTTSVKLLLTK